MSADPLMTRTRTLWESLAGAPVAFAPAGGPTVVTAPASALAPPGWVGIVLLGDAALVTAPTDAVTHAVRRALADVPTPSLTDPAVVARAWPVAEVLGPATLAYLSPDDFHPSREGTGGVARLPAGHGDLLRLLASVGEEDAGECGLDEITSPAFVVRDGTELLAAAGFCEWPGGTEVLTGLPHDTPDVSASPAWPRHCFSDLLTWVGCWRQAGWMGRGDLTNAEWDRLEPFLPSGGARGGRWSDHRRVINGVLYRVRTGVQWRDLPTRFGPWETVYKRHRRWSADGTWQMLLSRIQTSEDAAGGIDWEVSVDSTSVRAHQHAAGARKVPPAAIPQKGAVRGTNQVDPVLRKLAARLEEVVSSANAWDVPAADSPPRFTSPPTGDAGPSASS